MGEVMTFDPRREVTHANMAGCYPATRLLRWNSVAPQLTLRNRP